MPNDYYTTLGVARGATEKEIRSAYRKLARKLHPDVNPGDQASESRFKEINAAYDVLSDADKRKKYDVYGDNWEHADEIERSRRNRGGHGGNSNFEFREFNFGDGGDIFEGLFGGGRGRSRGRPRNLNVEQNVEVTLEEAASGATRTVVMGGGFDGNAGGATRRIEVRIPAGVNTGSRVRVAGEGMEADGRKGDLYLVIQVRPSDRFERKGDDLHTDVEALLTTAVLGGEVEVQGINRKVVLKLPPLTQNGRVFRLAGLGIPHLTGEGKGDLYARIKVRLPERLGDEEREFFEQLKEKGI